MTSSEELTANLYLIISSAMAATNPDLALPWAAMGATAGGFVNVIVFSKIDGIGEATHSRREVAVRWIVNILCGTFMGGPFARYAFGAPTSEIDKEAIMLFGFLLGVFGVAILMLIKVSMPAILSLISKVKFGVTLKDIDNEKNVK